MTSIKLFLFVKQLALSHSSSYDDFKGKERVLFSMETSFYDSRLHNECQQNIILSSTVDNNCFYLF